MDSTPSLLQTDPRHDVDVTPSTAPGPWIGVEVEAALSRLAQRAACEVAEPRTRTDGADVSAGPQVAAPSALAAVRPAELRAAPFASETPLPIRRAGRGVTGFLIAVCVGVAGSLAWQSYGSAAREMIASRVPQLAWIAPRAGTTPAPPAATAQSVFGPAVEASAPPPPPPPASVAQTAAEHTTTGQPAASAAVPPVPAAPPPDQQQLAAMAREIGALRQTVEQLAAREDQMARDMAKLHAADASRHRTLGAPPRPLGVLVNRPPAPAAPQVSSAGPSALPYPQPAPQMAPQPPPSAAAPQAPRPPAPVLGQP